MSERKEWVAILDNEVRMEGRKRLLQRWDDLSLNVRKETYRGVRRYLFEDLGYYLAPRNCLPDPRNWTDDFLMRCIEAAEATMKVWEDQNEREKQTA